MQIFPVLSQEAETFIPVLDGSFYTESMAINPDVMNHDVGTVAIVFYNGAVPTTPTGGTISFAGSPIPGVYAESDMGESTIDATQVIVSSDGVIGYDMPVFEGPMYKGRVTLLGVIGVTHFKAEYSRW